MNAERREELVKFNQLPDHAQTAQIDKTIKKFMAMMPAATSLGINMIGQLVHMYARVTQDKDCLKAFDIEDKKINDQNLEDLYDNE